MRSLLAAVSVAALAGAASASPPRLRVQPRVAHAGAVVHVRGNADGCPRPDSVAIISRAFPGHGFAGLGVVYARVRAGGRFAATARIRRAAHGRYRVSARCGGGNLGVVPHIRVV